MSGAYKTPGVYIIETNPFPNSVVEVATAVPAFIGYTEIANNKGNTLHNKPWRISSMAEFTEYFGGAAESRFTLSETTATTTLSLTGKYYRLEFDPKSRYMLYPSMQLFFQNGGGACYIVSVGDHTQSITADVIKAGIDALKKEQEPTMVLVPDAVLLSEPEHSDVNQYLLQHCSYEMKNRFAILDIHEGYKERKQADGTDIIDQFRQGIGTNGLNYGAAYYPWLHTNIVTHDEIFFTQLEPLSLVQFLLQTDIQSVHPKEALPVLSGNNPASVKEIHQQLWKLSPFYKKLVTEACSIYNLLPPAAAMAGAYTMVDNTYGVWKAPANIALNCVVSPAVAINDDEQEDLNMPLNGKAVNAIRTFPNVGVLVWGTRTLDGNSSDWRYINVRRTLIMLEESIKLASESFVFEPNVANTWVTVKSMISNFLTSVWKRGGLAGASPEDAFMVSVGLGETMTPNDILEGIMRVTVLLAPSHPAEFIEISFQQQMQKS